MVILLFNVTFPFVFSVVGLTYNTALYLPLGGYSLFVFLDIIYTFEFQQTVIKN